MIDYATPLLLTLCGIGLAVIGAFLYEIGRSDEREHAKQEYEVENAKLREQYETVIADYRSEVAKLRELVRELWEGYNDPRCEECQLKDTPTCADCPICAREALVIDRVRELGIEVEG